MDEMYELLRTTEGSSENPPASSHDNLTTTLPSLDYQNLIFSSSAASGCAFRDHHRNIVSTFGSEAEPLQSSGAVSFTPEFHGGGSGGGDVIKAKIASHPSYPRLLQAFIDCQKVGAPPEIVCLLEEIRRDNRDLRTRDGTFSCYGTDPELDEFMEVYCDMLVKYKSDLAKPVDEANTFLSKIETQLNNLCTDEGAASSSEEEPGMAEAQEAQSSDHLDMKDRLLRKFGAHIGTLKLEFSKKKKKGKLPKEARQTLLDWWNVHYRWPYPTEADKIELAESTGLDQRQINNWFINQRKRHWKPSEHMHFTVMENTSA